MFTIFFNIIYYKITLLKYFILNYFNSWKGSQENDFNQVTQFKHFQLNFISKAV